MTNNVNQENTEDAKSSFLITVIAAIALVVILTFAIVAGIYQFNNIKNRPPEEPKTPETCQKSDGCSPKNKPSYPCPEYKNDCYKPTDPITSIPSTKPNKPNSKPQTYLKQTSQWGQQYKDLVGNTEKNKFTAVYLDQSWLNNKYVDKETVDKPAINYAWSDFKNIKSEDFAVYYYGNLEFDKQTIKEISVSQSWSKSKVYIDEFLVFDSENDSGSFTYDFSAGNHTIEIEYENNWHTVEFMVNIADPINSTTLDYVATVVNADHKDYNLYYAGLYESSDRLLTTKLNIPKNEKPIVLIISSYSPINWDLTGEGVSNVRYIMINSLSKSSSVLSSNNNIKIYNINDLPHEYTILPNCNKDPRGSVYCENKGLADFNDSIKKIFGKNIDGVSGKYNADSLNVPEQYTDSDAWEKFKIESQDLQKNGSKVDPYDESKCVRMGEDLICP